MKAVVVERYGPPEAARIVDVPKPVPGEKDVLIKVHATTVNSGDARLRAARVPRGIGLMFRLSMGWNGPRKNKIAGFEATGEVEMVGRGVTAFKPGDRVVVSRGFTFGCQAEYVVVPETGTVAKIPDGLNYVDAVSLPFGGVTSLAFFRKGRLKAGEHILINGASGAVGVMAIQIAKDMGAEVTAVCSGRNADLVSSLGADHVIDYTKQDFTRSDVRYDLIMDNHGNAPYTRIRHLLKPGGRFLMVIGDMWQMLTARGNKAIIGAGDADEAFDAGNYALLMQMAVEGRLRPVIEKVLPFDQVAEAHRIVDGGHKVGSVVLTL